MVKQVSYSQLEQQIRPHFRNDLNNAESDEDVKKFFVYSVRRLIEEALTGAVSVHFEDFSLDPGSEKGFTVSEHLLANEEFLALWNQSDLKQIIERMAVTGLSHCKHFKKMPDKTESKMFPVSDHSGHKSRKSVSFR